MLRHSLRAGCLAAALLFVSPVPLAAQHRRFQLDDVKRLVRVSDPQFSPDGRQILVVVSRPDYALNGYRSELIAVDAASGEQTVLVTGRGAVSHARWSPAGDRIAVLLGGAGGRQVHLIAANGGEPYPITRSPTSVQLFAWRPDGRAIAYVAADPRPQRPDSSRFDDSFLVGNDHYMTTAAPMPHQLWVAAADGSGDARRLTSTPGSLVTGLGANPLSWSPDGRALVVVRYASASSGDSDRGVVTVVDARSGDARRLTGHPGGESAPVWSPDGAHIAYAFPRGGIPANQDEAMVAPAPAPGAAYAAGAPAVAGSPGVAVTRGLDRNVLAFDWWPDSKSLFIAGTDGTVAALWLQPLAGPARRLDLGTVTGVTGASISSKGAIALIGTERSRPAELYLLPSPDARPRRLTSFHDSVAELGLAYSERLVWRSHDGHDVDGVLTYPPGFDAARRWPLVLLVHGGPTSASTESFSPLAQLMAARGWLVLQPNYRGSNNLGNAFQAAIADDAAEGPGRDIVAGLDALVARGIVDTARVGVSGWSYGGFMTAWLIGRYPDRWRAAVAGAAPVDLTDMYTLTDLNVIKRHAITESPFATEQTLQKYLAMSPLLRLPSAKAPTLVMSMTGDVRVVVTGSYKILHALRDRGVPVEFVAFPGGGHSPADPVRQLERDRRWLGWLERWLGEGPRPAPVP